MADKPDTQDAPTEAEVTAPEPFQPYGKTKKDRMAQEPVVAPDGHVSLSDDDIAERDSR